MQNSFIIESEFKTHFDFIQISARTHAESIQNPGRTISESIQNSSRVHSELIQNSFRSHPEGFVGAAGNKEYGPGGVGKRKSSILRLDESMIG